MTKVKKLIIAGICLGTILILTASCLLYFLVIHVIKLKLKGGGDGKQYMMQELLTMQSNI